DYKRAIRQKQIAEYMEEEKQKTPKVDILGGKEFLTPTEGALLSPLEKVPRSARRDALHLEKGRKEHREG
ncbi:MAG: hypothetical protein IJS59_03675, partial [Bacteroidaceae bacterium]|nr:hypothetical protein [Bacteroidaceae bacterium]